MNHDDESMQLGLLGRLVGGLRRRQKPDNEEEYISMSSMKTKTPFLSNGANIWFMTPWKVAGALVRPNGITRNSYKPL